MVAAGIVVVWAVTGPLFQYSDTWQLVINTGTTIVTFLMVFSFRTPRTATARRSRSSWTNSFGSAQHIIRWWGIEHLTDEELEEIRSKCERRAEAEKVGEASVKRTGKKAREAAASRRLREVRERAPRMLRARSVLRRV
jgi:low affinity Fe/Cu permease